ncbi:MAG: thiamine phosphate synthase [Acidobacteria bacterium]|nr:thiamine phosphate synthase [Acidobacteriota bacterium]
MRQPLPRLYAILDTDTAARYGLASLDLFDGWLRAGIQLVQLRAKTMASGALLDLADAMAARAREAGITLIVNDRADIAALARASGVHVGQDDLAPRDVRQVVGDAALVGVSTHTPAQAAAALETPIDYLAIGPVFATTTKDRPDPIVGLEGVAAAASIARPRGVPVVAIGGITAACARAVLDAGAASVAVAGGLIGPDPERQARAFLRALASR